MNISFLLYANQGKTLDCRTEEKYRDLAQRLALDGHRVSTFTWNGANLDDLREHAKNVEAFLIWVNPIHRGLENGHFENCLRQFAADGIYLSSHPDVIGKIGTKRVLFDLAGTRWVPEALCHEQWSVSGNLAQLQQRLDAGRVRVLKQFRGNDGLGIYKLEKNAHHLYSATEANSGETKADASLLHLLTSLQLGTTQDNPTVEVNWQEHLSNGIVRCYFSVDQVLGFGYQEVNALYPNPLPEQVKRQRFYLTEQCGIFSQLKQLAETEFIHDLTRAAKVEKNQLPYIWDADFFICDLAKNHFELCEINASCVSPFPPSAIRFMGLPKTPQTQ